MRRRGQRGTAVGCFVLGCVALASTSGAYEQVTHQLLSTSAAHQSLLAVDATLLSGLSLSPLDGTTAPDGSTTRIYTASDNTIGTTARQPTQGDTPIELVERVRVAFYERATRDVAASMRAAVQRECAARKRRDTTSGNQKPGASDKAGGDDEEASGARESR
jgi:hypothetical protein